MRWVLVLTVGAAVAAVAGGGTVGRLLGAVARELARGVL